MTKEESGKNAYRTYCRDRLVVSESADEVYAEDLVIEREEPKPGKVKKPMTLFIK